MGIRGRGLGTSRRFLGSRWRISYWMRARGTIGIGLRLSLRADMICHKKAFGCTCRCLVVRSTVQRVPATRRGRMMYLAWSCLPLDHSTSVNDHENSTLRCEMHLSQSHCTGSALGWCLRQQAIPYWPSCSALPHDSYMVWRARFALKMPRAKASTVGDCSVKYRDCGSPVVKGHNTWRS